MTRLSIILAKQNDKWLKNQVLEEEFNSKSEAINYLIKRLEVKMNILNS